MSIQYPRVFYHAPGKILHQPSTKNRVTKALRHCVAFSHALISALHVITLGEPLMSDLPQNVAQLLKHARKSRKLH